MEHDCISGCLVEDAPQVTGTFKQIEHATDCCSRHGMREWIQNDPKKLLLGAHSLIFYKAHSPTSEQ